MLAPSTLYGAIALGLGGPRGYGDLGYEEVDIVDGSLVHRMLFSGNIEMEIRFQSFVLRYENIEQKAAQLAADPGRSPWARKRLACSTYSSRGSMGAGAGGWGRVRSGEPWRASSVYNSPNACRQILCFLLPQPPQRQCQALIELLV